MDLWLYGMTATQISVGKYFNTAQTRAQIANIAKLSHAIHSMVAIAAIGDSYVVSQPRLLFLLTLGLYYALRKRDYETCELIL